MSRKKQQSHYDDTNKQIKKKISTRTACDLWLPYYYRILKVKKATNYTQKKENIYFKYNEKKKERKKEKKTFTFSLREEKLLFVIKRNNFSFLFSHLHSEKHCFLFFFSCRPKKKLLNEGKFYTFNKHAKNWAQRRGRVGKEDVGRENEEGKNIDLALEPTVLWMP